MLAIQRAGCSQSPVATFQAASIFFTAPAEGPLFSLSAYLICLCFFDYETQRCLYTRIQLTDSFSAHNSSLYTPEMNSSRTYFTLQTQLLIPPPKKIYKILPICIFRYSARWDFSLSYFEISSHIHTLELSANTVPSSSQQSAQTSFVALPMQAMHLHMY